MEAQSMLMTYLPKNCVVITNNEVEDELINFWKEVVRRYEDRRHNIDQPILPPEELF
jgi:transcription-repair coupling factor (superfamily II helicase)